MTSRRDSDGGGRIAGLAGAAFLVLLVGASAALLLPACGLAASLRLSFLSVCPDRAAASTAPPDLLERNGALVREIAELEAELAGRQCVAVAPEPVAPPRPAAPDAIDEEGWRRGDVASLAGCWELDSDYRTRDIRTGVITEYDRWSICFDENGAGTQRMGATNGITCEGPVTGGFEAGTLSIREPGNLRCSNGSFIHQREVDCRLDGQGTANCDSLQRETGGQGTARLRRASGEP
jgi:hypothetical protein